MGLDTLISTGSEFLTIRLSILAIRLLELVVEALPLLIEVLSVVLILLHSKLFLLVGIHSECLLEGEGVNFLQDGLEGNQTFLQNPIE